MTSYFAQSLTRRFLALTAGVILVTAFSSQMFFARQERTNLETRLREKAQFINKHTADAIAAALIQKDDITLLQSINKLEDDPEIFAVYVVDPAGRFRYIRDAEKIGTPSEDPALANTLKTGEATITSYQNSGGKALALLTPMVVRAPQGQVLLGAIRIDLTYRTIERQVTSSRRRFWFVILGSFTFCFTIVTLYVNRWVLDPLKSLRTSLAGMNVTAPDSNLYEGPDELGKFTATLNLFLQQLRAELQHKETSQSARGDQEVAWLSQLATTLLPGARIIVADKDNRVVSDSDKADGSDTARTHLLDLITDTNFANLLTGAFQKEGEASRGAVTFKGKNYNALILSVPAQQSVAVKTLIALLPN